MYRYGPWRPVDETFRVMGSLRDRHLILPLTNPRRGARAVISLRLVDRQLLQVFHGALSETSLVRKGHSACHNRHREGGLQEVRTM
jgi:hypothetical protein